jgi:methionyl-tRNA formyltransferase
MRIVFIGCVRFSFDCLKKLIEIKAYVVGIVTKEESDFNADFCNLTAIGNQNNIQVKQVRDINHPNNISWIKSHNPDILFCFGWSSLLKYDLLNVARMGVVGYHPADLPNNKGRHPLIWAKVLGLDESASTFFFMDESADGGDILNQRKITIAFEESAVELYEKMTRTALLQIEEFLPQLVMEIFPRMPQDRTIGNHWRKRGKGDGFIDFRMTTKDICNLVRALSKPYAGAHCNYEGLEHKVWKVEPANFVGKNIEPGKILKLIGNVIEVKTADASILIQEHEIVELPVVDSYFL